MKCTLRIYFLIFINSSPNFLIKDWLTSNIYFHRVLFFFLNYLCPPPFSQQATLLYQRKNSRRNVPESNFPTGASMETVSVHSSQRDRVTELTKLAQERNMDPLIWAMQLSSSLNSAGISLPSNDVAELLVSHICWSNNVPHAWKLLEKALTVRIVPPLFVLALLSTRSFSSPSIFWNFILLFSEIDFVPNNK